LGEGKNEMKNEELPRGVRRRGESLVVSFALIDGKIERRALGPVTVSFAVEQLGIYKRQVREGNYEKRQQRKPAEPSNTIEDVWTEYLRAYRNAGKKAEWRQVAAWAHLKPVFAEMLPGKLTTAALSTYQETRQAEGAAPATVNRELSALSAAFFYAAKVTVEDGKPLLAYVPVFPAKLKESAPREGFVTDTEYAVLAANAKELWLRCLIACAYSFGFRRGELLNLRVRQVDFFDRWIDLRQGTTKNNDARKLRMTAEVFDLVKACATGKDPDDFIFTREDGQHVVDPRKSWYRLCVASGLGQFVPAKRANGKKYQRYEGLILHDFRRSFVRNATRLQIPETVVLRMGGWRTASICRRYNITSENDLIAASEKIEASRQASTAAEKTDTKTRTSPFSDDLAPNENYPKWFKKNGGDDETRTRDLCRDRAAF
jgi:integrase